MWSRRSTAVLFWASAGYILLLTITALLAPWIAFHHPTTQNLDERLLSPGTPYILGTDDFGRDIFSRIIYGSRSALLVGTVSVSVSVCLGTAVGLIAARSRNSVDQVLMLLMDSLLSFPTILLAIAVVSFLGYGLIQVMLAIGVIFSPVFARLVRAETLSISTEGYIESARALGSSNLKIVFRHIIPNFAGKVLVQASITFALALVIEASLSYIGLGTQPPNPSWGLMLKDARNYLSQAPWMAVYPGLVLSLTVLCFNILGDTLAEMLNPKISLG